MSFGLGFQQSFSSLIHKELIRNSHVIHRNVSATLECLAMRGWVLLQRWELVVFAEFGQFKFLGHSERLPQALSKAFDKILTFSYP